MKYLFAACFLLALSHSAVPATFAETITYATINPGTATGTTGTIGGISYTYSGAYASSTPPTPEQQISSHRPAPTPAPPSLTLPPTEA